MLMAMKSHLPPSGRSGDALRLSAQMAMQPNFGADGRDIGVAMPAP
jgi:hypothetical protein